MNKLIAFFAFLVGLFAIFSIVKQPAVSSGSAPANSATQQIESFFLGVARRISILAVKAQLAVNRAFGFSLPVFGLGVAANLDEQVAKSLEELNTKLKRVGEIDEQSKKTATDLEQVTKLVTEIKAEMLNVRKAQIELRSIAAPRRAGEIGDEAAKYLAALYLKAGFEQGKFESKDSASLQRYKNFIEETVGKAAVSSSDIPLPVAYSGQVVELVSQWGAARRYGTVFPLGSGVVKLPKLTTDPTFGLIASSGSVGEKVPQVAWVTFTAEKFGGIVRLPSEIDDDSVVAMGQFVARYASRQMAYVEDYQLFRSTGGASGINGTAKGLTATVVDDSKTVALASTKTKYSDLTLAKARELRQAVDAAALGMSAYYFHPSFEQLFSSFNTSGDKPYIANGINGASLDGFPIRWIDVLPAYSSSNNASTVFGLFGDVSYAYLGVRGAMRFDVSKDVYFATDEVGIRALERLTTGKMAAGAVAGIITAAS